MEVSVDDHHESDVLDVILESDDRLEANRGAMVSRSTHVSVQPMVADRDITEKTKRVLSDERSVGKDVFSVRMDNESQDGRVTLAPNRSGSITSIDLSLHAGVSV